MPGVTEEIRHFAELHVPLSLAMWVLSTPVHLLAAPGPGTGRQHSACSQGRTGQPKAVRIGFCLVALGTVLLVPLITKTPWDSAQGALSGVGPGLRTGVTEGAPD